MTSLPVSQGKLSHGSLRFLRRCFVRADVRVARLFETPRHLPLSPAQSLDRDIPIRVRLQRLQFLFCDLDILLLLSS